MATPASQPNPSLIFETLCAFQRAGALRGAIDLEVFTHIADGASTAPEIAARAHASERGMRILCDFLTVDGFLTKNGSNYGLSQESALFLNKRSPAYMGSLSGFIATQRMRAQFDDVAAIVRKGGTVHGEGNLHPNDDAWVDFARCMAPMMFQPAAALAGILAEQMGAGPMKVLDIAASHGLWGIAIAQGNPQAQVVGLDWPNVLQAAIENAARFGVSDRFTTIAGSAFEVDLGSDYNVILIPNFLHHFDVATNVAFLKKIRAAIKPEGIVATVEMVPNADRVSPPTPATFAMMMLGTTASGDAYTFPEFEQMFKDAGFASSTVQDMPFSPEQLILTRPS